MRPAPTAGVTADACVQRPLLGLRGTSPAVVLDDLTLSHDELRGRVDRWAAAHLGGTRRLVLLENENTLDSLVAHLAVVETSPEIIEHLDSLDRVPHLAGSDARSRHNVQLARLDDADERDRETRTELEAEKARLESAIDPAPDAPAWLQPTPEGEVPLWRAVNFADVVPAADRAGLEGGLLASGLLLATVTADEVCASVVQSSGP